jgi:hypothetical protein
MRRCVVFAAVVAVTTGLGPVVGTSAATAAVQCQYIAQDLPLPSGASIAEAVASTNDNTRILGEMQTDEGPRGVIWQNGAAQPMAAPTRDVFVLPADINSSGVVVGAEQGLFGNQVAFRYVNGQYELLFTGPNEDSMARGINDNGDIVGLVYNRSSHARSAVVWPAGQAGYQVIGSGDAIAVSENRKVLTADGLLFTIADGSRVRLNAREPFVLDNERIFGWGFTSIPEWDLNGRVVRYYDRGVEPLGVNNHGALFGGFGIGSWVAGVWRDGVWTAVQSDKKPMTHPFGDITDDDVLIGNYRDGNNNDHAARWFCVTPGTPGLTGAAGPA